MRQIPEEAISTWTERIVLPFCPPWNMEHQNIKSNAKNWCFTINNYMGQQLPCCDQHLYCAGFDEETMKYMIVGREVGTQGTPHLQGYVQFKKKMRLSAIKKIWPTAHLEVAKGTLDENNDYCKKDQFFCTHGEPIKKGQRTDLESFIRETKNGTSVNKLRDDYSSTFIRYPRGVANFISAYQSPRDCQTEVLVYWGPTGTGKSRRAHEEHPGAYWWAPSSGKEVWFDGYEGQEYVIFDEFYGQIPFSLFLRLADRYPLRVPIKGGFVQFRAKRIILTSNQSPEEWWPGIARGSPEWAAFLRRLTTVVEISK